MSKRLGAGEPLMLWGNAPCDAPLDVEADARLLREVLPLDRLKRKHPVRLIVEVRDRASAVRAAPSRRRSSAPARRARVRRRGQSPPDGRGRLRRHSIRSSDRRRPCPRRSEHQAARRQEVRARHTVHQPFGARVRIRLLPASISDARGRGAPPSREEDVRPSLTTVLIHPRAL
jgi:hypothetical protein